MKGRYEPVVTPVDVRAASHHARVRLLRAKRNRHLSEEVIFHNLFLVHGSGRRDGRQIGKMAVTLWSGS